MQALIAPLKELAEYDEIRKVTRQGKGTVALSGCVDSQKLHMIYGLSDGLKYKVIVTYSDLKAKEIYEEYRFYDRNVMLYPAKDLIFSRRIFTVISWCRSGSRPCAESWRVSRSPLSPPMRH